MIIDDRRTWSYIIESCAGKKLLTDLSLIENYFPFIYLLFTYFQLRSSKTCSSTLPKKDSSIKSQEPVYVRLSKLLPYIFCYAVAKYVRTCVCKSMGACVYIV